MLNCVLLSFSLQFPVLGEGSGLTWAYLHYLLEIALETVPISRTGRICFINRHQHWERGLQGAMRGATVNLGEGSSHPNSSPPSAATVTCLSAARPNPRQEELSAALARSCSLPRADPGAHAYLLGCVQLQELAPCTPR